MEQIREYYNKYKFQVHLGVLTFLFLINCFWGEFVFVSLGLAIFLIIISTFEDAFSILVFCIPFISIASPYSYSLYLVGVFTFVVKAYIKMYVHDKLKPSKYLIATLVIFILYLLIPFSPYNLNFFVKFVCLILLFLLLNIFLKYKDSIRLKYNVGILAISVFISSLFLFTYPFSLYLQNELTFYYSAGIPRFSALLPNPNPLAMICQIGLSILVAYIISKKAKPIDFWFFIIFATVGILTMSKTFIIVFTILLIILFFYALNTSPKTALVGIFSILVPLIFMLVLKNDFIMHYVNRFITGFLKDFSLTKILNIITTGRYMLWMDYINYLVANPLVLIFGRGLGAGLVSYESPHNFFITLIYNIGLIGVALFVLIIVAIIRVYRKNFTQKFNWAILIPFFVITLIMLVEDFFLFIRV